MKRIIQFFFLLTMCISAYSQAVEYNTIATAYVTTTISQNVVFNDAMKAGGTFTFSALAHNGGGRAGQADTANVKIQFFTASGTLVSTVNSNYSANLPIPTAQDPPRADPAVPWTTLTTSSTNCGGSCANVAYATVSMYGVDASFWAGDYGPWYRAPTLQQNGGSNLLYNPEFGPAYGYNAQGWTTSPAMGACQGAWGGSNPCIVNSSGVPGSSTVGLVANANGGGPSTSGGTTSGTAGGYNNTMSVTNAGPGTGTPQTAPAPTKNWQPILTTSSPVLISNIYPTSNNSPYNETAGMAFDGNVGTKYLNFDKQNAGVTIELSQGRVVQKFTLTTANDAVERDPSSYKLYGSNDGVNWVLIQEGSLALSDGRYVVSGDIAVTNTNAYVYYFIKFPSVKDNSGNSVQIAEVTYYYDLNDGVTSTSTSSGSTPSNPGTSGSVCTDCGPTIVSNSTSNSVSTSSSSVSSNTTNSYTATGYNYSFTGTVTNTTVTTVTTPVTTTTWSDGSTTTSSGTPVTTQVTTPTYTITPGQTQSPADRNPFRGTLVNAINIDQTIGSANNIISARQKGSGNDIEMTVTGSNNTVNINQGFTVSTAGIPSESTTVSNNNFAAISVNGGNNALTSQQTGLMNSVVLDVTGNYNTIKNTQAGNSNQSYISANGNNNSSTVTQTGNNNLSALNSQGYGNNITVGQTGNGNGALVSATNAGGAVTVNLLQQTATTGNTFVVQQTCTNGAGCSVSVQQNK